MQVIAASRADELAARLAQTIDASRAADPFATVHVLVNEAPLRTWLVDQLAERLGVVANVSFERLHAFVAKRIRRADPSLRVLSTEALRSLVMRAIRDSTSDPALEPVRRWLGTEAKSAEGVAAFQLAGRIAALFDHYAAVGAFGGQLAAWRAGGEVDGEPDDPARWQSALYRHIFGADGTVVLPKPEEEGSVEDAEPLRWMLLGDALEAWEPDAGDLPDVVHVFAASPAERGALDLLRRLGRHTPVELYLIEPGAGATVRPEVGAPTEAAVLPLARLAVDWALPPGASPTPTGRCGAPAPAVVREVAAAPTPEREMAWVADRVWRAIEADDTLQFRDIGVLVAARERAPYLAHATVAFDRAGRIPLDRVGNRSSGAEGLVDAMRALVRLPDLRFGREEILGILAHPSLSGGRLEDAARWRGWASSLNVCFGIDSEDLAGTYLDDGLEVFHWDQAARRLALGAFMSGPQSGEMDPFEVADRRWLPHELPEDAIPAAGRLVDRVRALAADAAKMRAASWSLTEWGAFFAEMARRYLKPDASDAADEVRSAYRSVLDVLYGLRRADVDGRAVPHQVAWRFAAAALEGVGTEGESYGRSGVAIGGLAALRGVPFRVVFVVGLNGDFPARPHQDPLDLLGGLAAPTWAARDRWLFLEALASARESVYLAHPGADPVTGVERMQSLLLRELTDALPANPPRTTLSIQRGAGALGNARFDPSEARIAAARVMRGGLGEGTRPPTAPGVVEAAGEGAPEVRAALGLCEAVPRATPSTEGGAIRRLSLPATAIREFLECPLQASTKRVLRLFEDGEAGPGEDEEPLTINKMQRAIWCREAFWATARTGASLEACLDHVLERETLLGNLPIGPFRDPVREVLRGVVGEWVEALDGQTVRDWQPVRFGRADEFLDGEPPGPPIRFEAEIEGERTQVELHGGTESMSPAKDAALYLVAGRNPGKKDRLRSALAFVFAAAAGHCGSSSGELLVVGSKRDATTYDPPSQDEARTWLKGIVESLFNERHDYLFPYDRVVRFLGKSDAEITDGLEACRLKGDIGCSRYGPVRDAAQFDPPPNPNDLIEQRLGMILGRMGGAS